MKNPTRLLLVAASSAHAASITLANGDFEGGVIGSTNPTGWIVSEDAASNEIYAVAGANGFTSTLLHFKDRATATPLSIFQNLTTNDTGLTADSYGSYALTLDLGWRTDRINGGAATGNATLLFELVNVTDSTVLATSTFTLLQRSTPQYNVYTLDNPALQIAFNYDNTAGNIAGDAIGLRITRTDVGGNLNNSVLWMDNLSVTAVPEPSTYGLISAGMLASAAFVRRRRKFAGKAA